MFWLTRDLLEKCLFLSLTLPSVGTSHYKHFAPDGYNLACQLDAERTLTLDYNLCQIKSRLFFDIIAFKSHEATVCILN